MDEAQLKRLWTAIDLTHELFGRRPQAGDWHRNIIDGSKGLKDDMEWRNFYCWLANPTNFVPKIIELDKTEGKSEMLENFKYPDGVEERIFKNGTETIVHIVNHNWFSGKRGQDDEKVPC